MFHETLFLCLEPTPVFGKPGTVVDDELPLEEDATVQVGFVIMSLINVTWPLRARSLPSMFAPFATVIELRARMVPLNTAVVLIVAVSTRQKTLQA